MQYYEVSNSAIGLPKKADTLLALYNHKTRRLSLKNVYGDLSVRAGSGIMVALELGDILVNQYFICEVVTHTFKADIHLMDITLRGADFLV